MAIGDDPGTFNLDKDVKITGDGLFRTGQDSIGYVFKYEAKGIVFWFDCEPSFISSDQDNYVLKISAIGKKKRLGLPQLSFNQLDRQTIFKNIAAYFRKNTMEDIMSGARLVQIQFLVDPPFAVPISERKP